MSINKVKKQAALIWLWSEIIQIIVFFMGALMLLWLYAPYHIIAKLIITLISTLIVYDIFKNFVFVRWILWKQQNEED